MCHCYKYQATLEFLLDHKLEHKEKQTLWEMMSHYALVLFEEIDSAEPIHVFLSSSP